MIFLWWIAHDVIMQNDVSSCRTLHEKMMSYAAKLTNILRRMTNFISK